MNLTRDHGRIEAPHVHVGLRANYELTALSFFVPHDASKIPNS